VVRDPGHGRAVEADADLAKDVRGQADLGVDGVQRDARIAVRVAEDADVNRDRGGRLENLEVQFGFRIL
jgi:hypothetical protein